MVRVNDVLNRASHVVRVSSASLRCGCAIDFLNRHWLPHYFDFMADIISRVKSRFTTSRQTTLTQIAVG